MKAQDCSDTVALTGLARIGVNTNANGKPNSFGVRFTDVYTNRNGRRQTVAWQFTKLRE